MYHVYIVQNYRLQKYVCYNSVEYCMIQKPKPSNILIKTINTYLQAFKYNCKTIIMNYDLSPSLQIQL